MSTFIVEIVIIFSLFFPFVRDKRPLSTGATAGFANVAGFVGAFYLHGFFSILGISSLPAQSAQLFFAVKILGAAYLIWLGVRALWDCFFEGSPAVAPTAGARRKCGLRAAFGEGFLTNALNPKVSMFYLAAFPQFIPAGEAAAGAAFLLVVVHSALNAIWFGGMVFLFARISGAARKCQRLLKGVTGIVLVGFGAKLAMLRQ